MLLSVIIPVYNRASLLPLTLESILQQTVPADEIIVVDDGSTDGTAEVAAAFGGPVKVLRQANSGPAAARNHGFRESKGSYIHFVDSDDIPVLNKQEAQLKALRHSGADIAYGPWVKGVFRDKQFSPANGVYQQKGLPRDELTRELLTKWSVVPHACLFTREIVAKAHGFPEDLFGTEDQLMFLNCLLAGAKVVHTPDTIELYRADNEDKITSAPRGFNRHMVEWGRFLVAAEHACMKNGIDPKRWFMFQLRAYAAYSELSEMQFDGKQELLMTLRGYFLPRRRMLYKLNGYITQKCRGIQHRIMGWRGSASFRMGKLTDLQMELIRKSGYSLTAS